jgi:broad specificity phosphatase PhoE
VTRLLLCRHAEAGNAAQGAALARALEPAAPAAVYTSPLARALETAAAVAAVHGLTPVEVDDLREIEFGDAEGLSFDELPESLRRALLREPEDVRFPGGENYPELQHRVCTALDEIVARHQGATVAVVSHAGAIRAALAAWLSIPDAASFRIDQRPASINVVEWNDGVPFVRLVNGARLG